MYYVKMYSLEIKVQGVVDTRAGAGFEFEFRWRPRYFERGGFLPVPRPVPLEHTSIPIRESYETSVRYPSIHMYIYTARICAFVVICTFRSVHFRFPLFSRASSRADLEKINIRGISVYLPMIQSCHTLNSERKLEL